MSLLRSRGHVVNPVGDSGEKTQSPGTYRPAGWGYSCPVCPYDRNGCYAQAGNVNLHSDAASPDTGASVLSAMVAMVAAVRSGRLARLHVSGDFATPAGTVDVVYIQELIDLARTIRTLYGLTGPVAWSYTHFKPIEFVAYRLALAEAGIVVRYSDHDAPGGAIVKDFASFRAGNGRAKCLAQVSDANCNTCRLCWERPDLTVVFDAHGSGRKRLLNVIQG